MGAFGFVPGLVSFAGRTCSGRGPAAGSVTAPNPTPRVTAPASASRTSRDLLIIPFTATPLASAATAAGGVPATAARTASTRRGGDAPAGEVAARASRPAPNTQP